MSRISLAVKYRPATFYDVVEQSAIKDILMDQIETGTFQHSYLFCGPAGCGKTTAARIFANDINGGEGSPIEVDAASNNGVDNVRDIIDGARRKPLDCDYKTYIIDECFHRDTLVKTTLGDKRISSIKPGEFVYNMTGVARVANVFVNHVFTNRLCCVIINGEQIITTVDHLFFTDEGWVEAQNLVEGDALYDYHTMSSMRARISGSRESHSKNLFDEVQEYFNFSDGNWKEGLGTSTEADEGKQPYVESRNREKDGSNSKRKRELSKLLSRTRREWALYEAPDSFEEFTGYGMETRISYSDESPKVGASFSYQLQSRPRLARFEAGDRGGWCRPQYEIATVARREKSDLSNEYRVERVEIYKRGDNDKLFERYFSREELDRETVEMYDLEVEGHPSYYVEGILVHNCHMLSIGAWNAMLKLLEEPPATAIFIMCTTDPQKIPATILSRVQRYNFSKISLDSIINRLRYIVACENNEILESGGPDGAYEVEEEAIQYIAKLADGGMRDAITMLDKCLSLTDTVTVKDAVRALGTVDYGTHFDLLFQMECGNKGQAVKIIEDVYNSGKDLKQFIKQFQYFVLDVCKFCTFHDFKYVNIPALPEYRQKLEDDDRDMALAVLEWARDLNSGLRWESNPKAIVESSVFLFNPPELR